MLNGRGNADTPRLPLPDTGPVAIRVSVMLQLAAVDWGAVPDWVSGIGTTLAFALALGLGLRGIYLNHVERPTRARIHTDRDDVRPDHLIGLHESPRARQTPRCR